MKRHAEIAGAGFAGLAAACALAQRGWSVRVHERGQRLRTTGAGIYIYENGLRVLAALGAYEEAVKGAPFAHTREVRDDRNRVISVHRWQGSRVFSIVRQRVIDALAAAAMRAGAEIVTGSVATGASSDGELALADGRKLKADLIVGADGSNSAVRDALGLLAKRKYLVDGATRLLIAKTERERLATDGIDTRVISLHTLKPLDERTLARVVAGPRHVFVVAEHVAAGGPGELVSALLRRDVAVRSLCLRPDVTGLVGRRDYILAAQGLDPAGIAGAVRDALGWSPPRAASGP